MQLLTGHEALRIFEASPNEMGRPRILEHDSLVKALIQTGPLKEQENIAGRLRGERKILWNRLGQQRDLFHQDLASEEALDALFQAPLTKLATNKLRSARRRGAGNQELIDLIRNFYLRDDLTVQAREGKDPIHIVSVMGVSND